MVAMLSRTLLHTLSIVSGMYLNVAEVFFLAENKGSASKADYRIKFKLDGASHESALRLIDSYPKGHVHDALPFKVTATGSHDGSGYLQSAVFHSCTAATGCDGVCTVASGTCDTPELGFELPLDGLLVAHVVCMLLSWGFLLPFGVLWARHMRTSSKKLGSVPVWFAGHRLIQSCGWLLQLMGFAFILAFKKASHFRLTHEVIGLAVVIIGTLQPLNAQFRHLPFIGHPQADGTRTPARKAWEFLHKGMGYMAVMLGVVNVILGLFW